MNSPCAGCGKRTSDDPNHYLRFCSSCLKGASYFSVAKEFSTWPAGVTIEDSRYSGERLRTMLEARMSRCPMTIDMNGTMGYGSDFLAAAFTSLGSDRGIPPEHFTIRCADSSIITEVHQYIRLRGSTALQRVTDSRMRQQREADLKEALYRACLKWGEGPSDKEELVARILSILPDPNADSKPWRKARHKTQLGTYELRLTRNGWDVREEGSSEHQTGVSPSYVNAEFVFD